ncbi:MAG: hypothetical protein DDT33_01544 [Firmicutes bacterium]|nr:hypothetical protein [Bacillota bacterium]
MEWEIVSAVLGLVAVVFGVRWYLLKTLLRETAEALLVISQAIEDNRLTRAEIEEILGETQDVIMAAKNLVGRKQ